MGFDMSRLHKISELPGFSPNIGRLVSMMNYVRWTTLEAVQGLTTEQLDYQQDGKSNSIGALLRHMAAVESVYYILSIEKRKLSESDLQRWEAALKLGVGSRNIQGYTLEEHIACLNDVRSRTLEGLKQKTDEWLSLEAPIDDTRTLNNHWSWFHVFEDEINHRGQIRILRKSLPM
jgi:uncharacterized damage-inducible protein DinB